MKKILKLSIFSFLLVLHLQCSPSGDATSPETPINPTNPNTPSGINEVDFWLTKGDETVKLTKQSTFLSFGTTANVYQNIEVNESLTYQTIDGYGFTLTGGSVQVINQLADTKKQELLQDLFNPATGIGISYLRISIGASDLSSTTYTYNDLPNGQTDLNLTGFSITSDNNLITMLKEILTINPNIKILATPWSAPVWMKDNNSFIGGSLQTKYYENYAQYFVKYIQAMKEQGITIDAITPQNEPLNPNNNPSMSMTAVEQTNFIKNNLGPAFQNASLATKIIIYDHNCDVPEYPKSILSDSGAFPFINGAAFHLYDSGVNIGALSNVHDAFPTKNVYFTEQYTASNGNFGVDLKWHLKNVIIGSMRNWSKNALEWNLANDGSFGPQTPGGCTDCKGGITITSGNSYIKNVAYYIIAHASKFVPSGSTRISTNIVGNLNNLAFKTPTGNKVLIVENDGNSSEIFNIKFNGKWITSSLEAGAVGTYTWK
jgi:glucosylceramidase